MNAAIAQEFRSAKLPDLRLKKRLMAVIDRLAAKPDASYPQIFGRDSAELEGFYRLMENPYVTENALLRPHIDETLNRCGHVQDLVVAHDTTTFDTSGVRAIMEREGRKGKPGLFGHYSLAVSRGRGKPLGILRSEVWLRAANTQTALRREKVPFRDRQHVPSEMDRWMRGIREVEASLPPATAIHVCDSETDSYMLLAPCVQENVRFVIRSGYNRNLAGNSEPLLETVRSKPCLATREVELSKRVTQNCSSAKTRNPLRKARKATLSVRACGVALKRSKNASDMGTFPASLPVNVVHVVEEDPPEDCTAVEWTLLTNEPIATTEDVLRIVDTYRARWQIEEFFKAIKTGCSYEARHFESLETLSKSLALFVPIAWQMLSIRFSARQTSEVAASEVLPPMHLRVLILEMGRPIVTAHEAYYAVAALGGHIKRNGPPGWLTLWQGVAELETLVKGALLGQKLFEMSLQRCDQ